MRLCLMFATASLFAAGSVASAQTSADERAIRGLDSLWARVYQVHDTVSALKVFDVAAVITAANGRKKNVSDELEDIRPYPGLVMEFFRSQPMRIAITGDSAQVSGIASWRFAMGGAPRDLKRSYEATYLRGGPLGWRIVALTMGSAPAP